MTQRGTQATGLCIMIGRCSPHSQHRGCGRYPVNVSCSFFRYMNNELRNHINHKFMHKTRTREDNHLPIHCYFGSNPIQRGYTKKIIEIWQECASCQKTSQILADLVKIIIKNGWFSALEMLEIHHKINNQTRY